MNARKIAYECLVKVIEEGQYANLMMRSSLNQAAEVDKGLITQIVYGTLRNYRLCRFQWEHFAEKKCNPKIAILLDMSVYQLFWLDKVPSYAVVNEMVDLTPQSSKGFVNAILRKVLKQGKLDSDKIAIQTSHPDWLVGLWTAHYGEEIMKNICLSDCMDANVVGRVNTIKCSKEELELDEKIHFLDDTAFVADFNLVQSDYFKEGKIVIQDESSQQVVKMMDLEQNLNVLDCCSAPGTKTSQIAMMMNNTGKIIAGELHEHRTELISTSMSHLGVTNVEVKQMDARFLHEHYNEEFDRILVDAPCSGLGVLKRKPDIKIRCTPESIDEIVELQCEILQSASRCLKKGGILVYSTCTLNKKENDRQIANFLKTNVEYELLCEKTIFSTDANKDGFYMAKLFKKA
ncbi:16S rRNA (cytosine(967)-C(5))-methyltransferase RsmB [Anaerorhabdus sp.]|uniref:16S rRNA (cytosine(967)-C(5))-methyltransferase RsmB n=1 Tax=Anaerorhabdus sp. TaxID=1872524 RepID=UPI002B2152D0|nr:16S rRNA (cytosine(967)-C(5))-methyltransferase RsmB [Anaerorhabdus sp.]MEA4874141.1 16S rRNA (cytosine(967)-C(5))-methyltransferase RsmB [Anaerorhabdus sp.]